MSGYSYTGGPSRCSPYWQEFTKCYASVAHPTQCAAQRDDYMECVHQTKEKARNLAIQAELERANADDLKERLKKLDVQADGVSARIGLIPPASEGAADKQ